jgi:hypothetical protein
MQGIYVERRFIVEVLSLDVDDLKRWPIREGLPDISAVKWRSLVDLLRIE